MNCAELLPRGDVIITGLFNEDGTPECLLHEGHTGDHLVHTQNGYFLWRAEENYCIDSEGNVCDCDYIECYTFCEITEDEAGRLLSKQAR